MMNRNLLVLGVISIGLSGCLSAQETKIKLIGVEKGKILSCAGAPNRESKNKGREYMTYSITRSVLVASYSCSVTFVIKNGKVEDINFTGFVDECERIVGRCLN